MEKFLRECLENSRKLSEGILEETYGKCQGKIYGGITEIPAAVLEKNIFQLLTLGNPWRIRGKVSRVPFSE